MLKSTRMLIAGLVAVLSVASTASAIVGGSVDGNAHPYVGALVVDDAIVCSGVLVAPTVFATAAHCLDGLADGARVAVSLDSSLDRTSWTLLVGSAHADPQYRGKTAHDLAVVVLDGPASVQPAKLPARNQVEKLSRGAAVTSVGFGYSAVLSKRDFTYDGLRHFAESPVKDVSTNVLTISTKHAGPCLGDSGGPQLLGDTVLAVTSSGSKDCSGSSESYRLDGHDASAFLAGFGLSSSTP